MTTATTIATIAITTTTLCICLYQLAAALGAPETRLDSWVASDVNPRYLYFDSTHTRLLVAPHT